MSPSKVPSPCAPTSAQHSGLAPADPCVCACVCVCIQYLCLLSSAWVQLKAGEVSNKIAQGEAGASLCVRSGFIQWQKMKHFQCVFISFHEELICCGKPKGFFFLEERTVVADPTHRSHMPAVRGPHTRPFAHPHTKGVSNTVYCCLE